MNWAVTLFEVRGRYMGRVGRAAMLAAGRALNGGGWIPSLDWVYGGSWLGFLAWHSLI